MVGANVEIQAVVSVSLNVAVLAGGHDEDIRAVISELPCNEDVST